MRNSRSLLALQSAPACENEMLLLNGKGKIAKRESGYLEDRQTEPSYVQLLEAVRHTEKARIRNGDNGIVRQAQDLQLH